MTHKVTKPIALDESLNTTEETPRNIADVLAEGLAGIGEALSIEAELPLKKVNGKFTNNGNLLTVTGNNAWAEGERTEATAGRAHAEGYMTKASAADAHAEGSNTRASGEDSHAEGDGCTASGKASHAGGRGTRMSADGGTAIGNFNSDDTALFVVGNGTDTDNRNDVFKVDSNGQTYITNYSGNLVKLRGAGIATFNVTQTDLSTFVYPNESDVRTAVRNYDDVILRLAPLGGGFINYVLDHQAVAVGIGTTYTWVREDGSRVITLEGSGSPVVWTWNESSRSIGGGSDIYGSLQDAIADAASLNVGEYFETNGFHTSGDGGAARYLVSNTGTANGMDIVQLSVGKLAVVQLKGSAYTEQIGYVVNSSQADVGPYIKRLLAMGIQTVKFYPTGSAPTSCYCIRDMLDLDRSDYHNVGVKLEGADIGQTSGYATWFNFQPSVSNADKIAIKIHARTTRIENIALIYGAGTSDTSVRETSAAICFDSTGNSSYQTSSYGAVIKNLTIQGFNTAILSTGTSPYIWHVDFEKITFAANNTHVSLDGLSYCTKFKNCLFNSPDVQSVYLGEPFTLEFDSCNFGIDNRGTAIIRSSKWIVPSAPVDEKRGTTLFLNCNFELEYNGSVVPQNNHHLFIYADDNSQIDFEFDNCCFIYTPLSREDVFSDRMFSLGDGCSAIIRNSTGPYSDVNYTGNEFYGKDFDKYFFDEERPPRKKVGSVILQHCEGIDPFPFLDDGHLPCFKKDEDVILCSDTTGLDTFERIEDGTILFNLDRHVPIVKIANDFADCASAPSGVVRIGNELYSYVTFDGRKWITRNLNLRIPTRQHTIFDHLEWGQYYKYSDLSAIQAKLPSGWRIPNASDVTSIVGDGSSTRAHNLQSLGVSYWTGATNSTGFSALPSSWWYKPNTTPHSTFKQYAFYWTTVTEGSNVKNISIKPNAVSSGGWTAGEAATLWIPLRVCADA